MKGILILLTACLLAIGFAGCGSIIGDNNKPKGNLLVTVPLPQGDEVADEHFLDQITLESVTVTLSKGAMTLTRSVSISGASVQIAFNNIEAGNWSVAAEVIDTEDYPVYSGSASATVQAGSTNSVSLAGRRHRRRGHPRLCSG